MNSMKIRWLSENRIPHCTTHNQTRGEFYLYTNTDNPLAKNKNDSINCHLTWQAAFPSGILLEFGILEEFRCHLLLTRTTAPIPWQADIPTRILLELTEFLKNSDTPSTPIRRTRMIAEILSDYRSEFSKNSDAIFKE